MKKKVGWPKDQTGISLLAELVVFLYRLTLGLFIAGIIMFAVIVVLVVMK